MIVIPAKAGIPLGQAAEEKRDPHFRGGDV
jgi:hypothetical protein